jgi:hypothetical protein
LKRQLQAEVETLRGLAEAADAGARPEGMDIPQELARREQRLARIEKAKAQMLTQAVNDKQQLIPALEKLRALPPELGTVQARVADSGFMSEANVRACAAPEVEDATPIAPLIALGRERHHADLMRRFAPEPLGPAPQEPRCGDDAPAQDPLQPVGSDVTRSDDPRVHTDR